MNNLRKYGNPPFSLAVIHGGPGAPGEMAPVARELSAFGGVLEPLQTEVTIEGQVRELKEVLEEHGDLPVTLIGFSWGAMLSFIFTARHFHLVKKLILIGSGPYEEKYAARIKKTRISRLGKEDLENFVLLTETLNDPSAKNLNETLCNFGKLMSKTDTYDPLPYEDEVLECNYESFKGVWEEASELRSRGKLLEIGNEIRCPVVAIHERMAEFGLLDLPEVGMHSQSVNYEMILTLKPDIVILPLWQAEDADSIAKNLPNTSVIVMGLASQKTINSDLITAGFVLGKEKEANELISWMQGYENLVNERIRGLKSDSMKRKKEYW